MNIVFKKHNLNKLGKEDCDTNKQLEKFWRNSAIHHSHQDKE